MSHKFSRDFRGLPPALSLAAALLLLASACNHPAPIVVGAMSDTSQTIVAEIVAQHLEHRLSRKIVRRFNGGNQMLAYQAVNTAEITLYPEYTGAILTGILKETADQDPAIVLERARAEILRTAKLELLDPLGYENQSIMVVRAADASQANITTLSEAAAGKSRWKLAVSYDFQQRPDGMLALNRYNLPLAAGVHGMDAAQLFPSLQSGDVTMINSTATDSHLSPEFKTLEDDKHVFPPAQACILARVDAFATEPKLRPALAELSGKFTNEIVRRMSAQVDLNHRDPTQVAAEFLTQIGLK